MLLLSVGVVAVVSVVVGVVAAVVVGVVAVVLLLVTFCFCLIWPMVLFSSSAVTFKLLS